MKPTPPEQLTNATALPSKQSSYAYVSAEEARALARRLKKYRDPIPGRTAWEIAQTVIPFALSWAAALWALQISYPLALFFGLVTGVFTIRMFLLQHDVGHGALFKTARANDRFGRVLGVVTLTPYYMWRKMHANHHKNLGNLDDRDIGEVHTFTVNEYRALPTWHRLAYQIYRNPLFLFGIGPVWLFFIQHRLPFGMWKRGLHYWTSAMGTNAAIAGVLMALYAYGGWAAIWLIWFPSVWVGASAGVWTFYVQHQFEEAQFDWQPNWTIHQKALHSSSQYVLPKPLMWITANMGIHHIHHLYARIPFYRLPEALENEPALQGAYKMTLKSSVKCIWMQLWDEDHRQMISFSDERKMRRNQLPLAPAE